MFKKIISLIVIVVMLFSVSSMALPATAIYYGDAVIYGDVNSDEKVNTSDAVLALRIAAGLKAADNEGTLKKADVNFDGKITLFDARQILRKSAGIVSTLEPSGAFKGFEGYKDSTINLNSPEAAIAVFNSVLNRVKTEHPGFTRSEASDVINFDINEVTLVGINFGNSVESVTQMVKDMIISETEPEEAQVIFKGTNTYNAMSVEGENYVSLLSASSAYGVKVAYDGVDCMTITVALPDSEIENISQTAYASIFNTELIKEDSESVIENVFSSNAPVDAKRKNVVNGVATLVFNTATGNVESYTTTYETDMYIASSKMGISEILSAELRGVQYGTRITVTYDNFQW